MSTGGLRDAKSLCNHEVRWGQILRAILVLCTALPLMLASGESRSQSRDALPRAPVDPTPEDCRALEAQYYGIIRQLHSQQSQCMRQRPIFGTVPACRGGQTMVAWSQCNSFELRRCEAVRHRDAEIRTCRASANARRAREREDAKSHAELLREANDRYEKARNLLDFVQDPKRYLFDSLQSHPKALDRIFGPSRDAFDADLAQEIYRYAHNQTDAGIEAGSNPLVKAIQREALGHIGRMHGNVLHQLDDLSEQIRRMDTRLKSELANRPRISPPASARPSRNASSECRYNAGKLEQYLDWCPANDGCTLRAQMEQIVQQSCE